MRRKYEYIVFQGTGTLFVFFIKMQKNNELNFNICGMQNPEDRY